MFSCPLFAKQAASFMFSIPTLPKISDNISIYYHFFEDEETLSSWIQIQTGRDMFGDLLPHDLSNIKKGAYAREYFIYNTSEGL